MRQKTSLMSSHFSAAVRSKKSLCERSTSCNLAQISVSIPHLCHPATGSAPERRLPALIQRLVERERTAHLVLEDGKTLDELIAPNDAIGQHLIKSMRADGATDQEIWQFMVEN